MWHYGGRPPKQTSLFWRETRQRILGHEISPYPEVVRGRERELTTRPRERQLVVGQERGELVAGPGRGVGGWTGKRAVAAGEQRGKQQKAVGVEERRGSQHQTPEQRGEETR